MPSPESICILRLSALGDVCNAVAAVQAIQKSFSNASITWIIGKLEHQLVHDLPGVEFIVFEKARGTAAIADLKQAMLGRSFDVLLHMQVAMRANRLARLIPARKKIGYDWKRAKEGHSLVVNERIPPLLPKSSEQHVLDSFMSFAQKIGAKEEHCYPPTWNIPVSEADHEFAAEAIPEGQQTMILCPAASKRERCWTPERYIEATHFVHRKGIKVILCGGPAPLDLELAEYIASNTRVPITNLVGKTTLKQLYALLGRALFVLAPDTGPLHLANAAGTAVVGLYAHSTPHRTGPYGSQSYVVDHYKAHLGQQFGKLPDQVKWGKRVHGSDLMDTITSEEVFDKIDHLLLELDS